MITIALIVISAILKAFADTLDDHFDTSIFRRHNPMVWDANMSKVRKWWITNYKPDPWHFANSAIIICLFSAILFNDIDTIGLPWYLDLLLLGVIYNVTFELFYSKIFRK